MSKEEEQLRQIEVNCLIQQAGLRLVSKREGVRCSAFSLQLSLTQAIALPGQPWPTSGLDLPVTAFPPIFWKCSCPHLRIIRKHFNGKISLGGTKAESSHHFQDFPPNLSYPDTHSFPEPLPPPREERRHPQTVWSCANLVQIVAKKKKGDKTLGLCNIFCSTSRIFLFKPKAASQAHVQDALSSLTWKKILKAERYHWRVRKFKGTGTSQAHNTHISVTEVTSVF